MMDDKTLAMLGDRAAQERLTERYELLPCPCCGEIPKMRVKDVEYGLSGTFIRCDRCGIMLYSPDKKTEIVMGRIRNVPIQNYTLIGIENWNNRAPILTPEQIKRLEGME